MAKELYGWRKNLFLSKVYITNREVRKLPFKFQLYLRKILAYEKFTKIGGKYVILSQVPPYPSEAFNRYFRGLFSTSKGDHGPLSLEFAVTNMCKYNCWHCSNEHRTGKDLSLNKLTKAITDFINLGVTWIGISGGEPLMRKDIVEIVRNIGTGASSAIFTTGYNLTQVLADKLKTAGLFSFVISLDSYKKDIHDKLRGFNGAYRNALNAIKISLNNGFYTVVSTVATHDNVNSGELEKLVVFCKKLGVHEVRILELAQSGELINDSSNLINNNDRKILFELHERANRSNKLPRVMVFPYLERPDFLGCTGGYHHITIDATGNVCPCPFFPFSFGNVVDDSVKTVWERLKTHFPKPRCNCMNAEHIEKIQSEFSGKLPFQYHESSKMLNPPSKEDTPLFYEKLESKK